MNRKHLCTGICIAVCLIAGSILLCCRRDDAENLLMEDGTKTEGKCWRIIQSRETEQYIE